MLAIARRLRRRNDLIVTTMRDLGIARKTVSRDWLLEHYVEKNEPIDDIAEHWGVTEETIRMHLRNGGISIRYKTRGSDRNRFISDHEWLSTKYVTEGLSQQRIADLAACNISAVVYALRRFGITRKRAPSGGYRKFESTRKQFTDRLRRAILARDGYRCRWPECGATERLEINHIVPLSEGGLTTFENGITLCRHHHSRIRGKELSFVALFQSLVSEGPVT